MEGLLYLNDMNMIWFKYDAEGRFLCEGNKTYRYGYLDKVLSVTDGDTTRTYTYHADGQLASATVGSALRADRGATPLSETETFLWDGLALIQRGDEPRGMRVLRGFRGFSLRETLGGRSQDVFARDLKS